MTRPKSGFHSAQLIRVSVCVCAFFFFFFSFYQFHMISVGMDVFFFQSCAYIHAQHTMTEGYEMSWWVPWPHSIALTDVMGEGASARPNIVSMETQGPTELAAVIPHGRWRWC